MVIFSFVVKFLLLRNRILRLMLLWNLLWLRSNIIFNLEFLIFSLSLVFISLIAFELILIVYAVILKINKIFFITIFNCTKLILAIFKNNLLSVRSTYLLDIHEWFVHFLSFLLCQTLICWNVVWFLNRKLWYFLFLRIMLIFVKRKFFIKNLKKFNKIWPFIFIIFKHVLNNVG